VATTGHGGGHAPPSKFGAIAGLHTGEIERHGDDIAGIAVHFGQRVASDAGPGEVIISRTVADLIAGSDVRYPAAFWHARRMAAERADTAIDPA
jgi:class 3 adenylate cyclase